jgi:hypothetical protein
MRCSEIPNQPRKAAGDSSDSATVVSERPMNISDVAEPNHASINTQHCAEIQADRLHGFGTCARMCDVQEVKTALHIAEQR